MAFARPQAAVQVAPQPVPKPAELGSSDAIGFYFLRDRFSGTVRTITVSATANDASGTTFSTGDKVGSNGQVLAVRLGNLVVSELTSGAFWKLPLQAGASGEVKARNEDNKLPAPHDIRWKVVEASPQRSVVEIIMYFQEWAGQPTSKRADVELVYRDGLPIPQAMRFEARPRGPGANSGKDFIVGELKAR
jgi:hypothetical protein